MDADLFTGTKLCVCVLLGKRTEGLEEREDEAEERGVQFEAAKGGV